MTKVRGFTTHFVNWSEDGGIQRVLIEADGISIEIVIGKSDIQVMRDGKVQGVMSDAAAFLRNGRTWLPLRSVGEILGAEFDYGPKDGPIEWVKFLR